MKDVANKSNGKATSPKSREGAKEIVAALNVVLANYSVHYQKLRNYHWNVKGSDFFDLHEQFELQYNEAKVNIDEIAERIRVFNATPFSTMKEYLEYSQIRETGTEISSDKMVIEILNDYKILLKHLMHAVEVSTEYSDSGTEEMAKKFIHTIEKHNWMLSAFSSK